MFFFGLGPSRTDLIKIVREYLLEGEESNKNIEVEACKLNIYSKGSSFRPHVTTLQSKRIFGSLVVVFPTHHKGGALFLRHRGHEWIFDPGRALECGASDRPSIGYVAYLKDIEQDVAPVTSGHCATLTYNLYFNDDGGPVSKKGAVSERFMPPKPSNQDEFREALNALLENPEFMADGGTLAFGLRHDYPIEHRGLQDVCNVLKGSDAVVYQSTRALGFEPMLYMYYDYTCGQHEGVINDKPVYFNEASLDGDEADGIHHFIQVEGGIPVRQDGGEYDYSGPSSFLHYNHEYFKDLEPIEWATPITKYVREERVYETITDKETMKPRMYGNPCMIVRIGKVGDRLGYPTVSQSGKAYKKSNAW